jgi:hypothetical protein
LLIDYGKKNAAAKIVLDFNISSERKPALLRRVPPDNHPEAGLAIRAVHPGSTKSEWVVVTHHPLNCLICTNIPILSDTHVWLLLKARAG